MLAAMRGALRTIRNHRIAHEMYRAPREEVERMIIVRGDLSPRTPNVTNKTISPVMNDTNVIHSLWDKFSVNIKLIDFAMHVPNAPPVCKHHIAFQSQSVSILDSLVGQVKGLKTD